MGGWSGNRLTRGLGGPGAVVGSGLGDEVGAGGREDAEDAEEGAEVPVAALAGEEGDGGDDEADFEEGFAEVEAGAAALGFFDVFFEVAGGFFGVGEVLLPFLQVGLVAGGELLGGGVVTLGAGGEQVEGEGGVVLADFFGLVEVPLVAGAGLVEDGFGVDAVAEDGDDGDEDGEDGHGEADGAETGFMRVFVLLLKFVDFVGFHRYVLRREMRHRGLGCGAGRGMGR
jgi:hypothetical protein